MKINMLIKRPNFKGSNGNGSSGAMSGVSHLKGSINYDKNMIAGSHNPVQERNKMQDSDFHDCFNSGCYDGPTRNEDEEMKD